MARRRTRTNRRSAPLALIRAVVLVAGLMYLIVGLSMFIQPEWFFENVGNFPPFNPHYMGDLGSFLVPVGVGLIVASRDPARYRMLISVAVAGSLLHSMNHLRDADGQPASFWLTDTLPILVFGLVFLWALFQLRGRRGS